jgi:hypothetical protein
MVDSVIWEVGLKVEYNYLSCVISGIPVYSHEILHFVFQTVGLWVSY